MMVFFHGMLLKFVFAYLKFVSEKAPFLNPQNVHRPLGVRSFSINLSPALCDTLYIVKPVNCGQCTGAIRQWGGVYWLLSTNH